MKAFTERLAQLPHLGVGISTEFGARREGLDLLALRARHKELVQFLEIGCDLARGADADARAWVAGGHPATYHFLDVNLEEPEDLDDAWVRDTAALARELKAAWMCGDAGLWHIGPRDRGHGTLMPPVLTETSARDLARGVRALRVRTGFEVLPENPPAHVYVGDMHLGDYFALVAEEADSGILLDVAHLAIYARASGRDALAELERFPLERVVEMHVAGGTPFTARGSAPSSPERLFIDDDHGTHILDETWALFETAAERASALRAVVLECERNRAEEVLPLYRRLHATLARARR